jgi:hypothetical protein
MTATRRYPPELCWVGAAGWIAAAPVAGVCESVGDDWVPVVAPCEPVGDVAGVVVVAGGGSSAGVVWEPVVFVGVPVVVPVPPVVVVALPVVAPVLPAGVPLLPAAESEEAAVPVGVTVEVALGVVVGVALPGVPACARTPELVGSIDVPGPVTSAPFVGVRSMNAVASGAWMLPSARLMSLPSLAVKYPTDPGGGRTMPMLVASRSIR